jgi:uncharacterized protein YjbI with pentapeptide repeats
MANEEQLSILKQGVEVWNKWRKENRDIGVDLKNAKLSGADLREVDLSAAQLWRVNVSQADLRNADLYRAYLREADLVEANLNEAELIAADLSEALLIGANLRGTDLTDTNLSGALLYKADLSGANLNGCNLSGAHLVRSNFLKAKLHYTIFGNSDLSGSLGLNNVVHDGPSSISTDAFALSKGKMPEAFLRGIGLSDWEIESVKLYNPDLTNEERNKVLYKVYDLQASQAVQISHLFISYSHADSAFVDKVGNHLTNKGIRYWRDIHEMKAGRIETQIDRGIRQNPTVLLILSEHSLSSDWVEHEVRTARSLEKEMGRDVLCPVALDDSWKSSRWPKRIMEQIIEYNILDFSDWRDDSKFDAMFRKLIDGLELFYKG